MASAALPPGFPAVEIEGEHSVSCWRGCLEPALVLRCCHPEFSSAETLVTDTSSSTPAPGQRGAERSSGSALDTALRRARWTIFWERLWPALATLATAAGLFLTISWLGSP
jgi:hypothetical protein